MKTLEVEEFKYIREEFPIQHEYELIKRKGVYPYGYMDSFVRFDESRLSSQDAFFSKLSDRPCSDTEYAHGSQVWTATISTWIAMSYYWHTSLRNSVQSA